MNIIINGRGRDYHDTGGCPAVSKAKRFAGAERFAGAVNRSAQIAIGEGTVSVTER